jgi:hypothetical protein
MGGVADKAHGPTLTKFFCYFLFTKNSLPFLFPVMAAMRR